MIKEIPPFSLVSLRLFFVRIVAIHGRKFPLKLREFGSWKIFESKVKILFWKISKFKRILKNDGLLFISQQTEGEKKEKTQEPTP